MIDKELFDKLPKKEQDFIIDGYCKENYEKAKRFFWKGLWEYFTNTEAILAILLGITISIIVCRE